MGNQCPDLIIGGNFTTADQQTGLQAGHQESHSPAKGKKTNCLRAKRMQTYVDHNSGK